MAASHQGLAVPPGPKPHHQKVPHLSKVLSSCSAGMQLVFTQWYEAEGCSDPKGCG